MTAGRVRRLRRLLGAGLLGALLLGLVLLLARPGVHGPLARAFQTIARDAFGDDAGDLGLLLDDTSGLGLGDPVFRADRPSGLEPAGWVASIGAGRVTIRLAPGERLDGAWRLVRLGAPRGLADAWRLAVPPEAGRALAARAKEELSGLLQESVLPELRRRLPEFLSRVDPRHDPRARAVLDGVGAAVAERLRPLADELVRYVGRDLEKRFGFLDRVSLLLKYLRGDTDALRGELVPAATESATRWWAARRDAVLTAVGEALLAEAKPVGTWLVEAVLPAARDTLLRPVLDAQAPAIERSAQRVLDDATRLVVEAPEGGFRVRFAAAVRSRLLEKRGPLLLLERAP